MDNNSKSYVLVEYRGELPLRIRLEKKGEKIEFKTGDIHFMHADRVEGACGKFKFVRVNPAEITGEMLKKAQSRLIKIEEEKDKLKKEFEKNKLLNEEKAEREKEMREELNTLKNQYNKKDISEENYLKEKEKIIAKWEKIFEGKKKKKELITEQEE